MPYFYWKTQGYRNFRKSQSLTEDESIIPNIPDKSRRDDTERTKEKKDQPLNLVVFDIFLSIFLLYTLYAAFRFFSLQLKPRKEGEVMRKALTRQAPNVFSAKYSTNKKDRRLL